MLKNTIFFLSLVHGKSGLTGNNSSNKSIGGLLHDIGSEYSNDLHARKFTRFTRNRKKLASYQN